MSSSGAAARDTRVNDLDRYMKRAIEANRVSRGALAATLFLRAENLASQLHDDTCLVPVWLRYHRALSIRRQGALVRKAAEETPREQEGIQLEAAAFDVQAWELVKDIIAVIERRKAAGTMVRWVASFGWTRSPLLHPVAEVWHVPRRGGGVLQALAGVYRTGEPAASHHWRP